MRKGQAACQGLHGVLPWKRRWSSLPGVNPWYQACPVNDIPCSNPDPSRRLRARRARLRHVWGGPLLLCPFYVNENQSRSGPHR